MQDVYKEIQGFAGYMVSDNGNVLSVRSGSNLIPYANRYGYMKVRLCNKGFNKMLSVHRLVALAFIDKVEGKDFVNHINGIKHDNRVENLEWVTKSENSKHSFEVGTQCNKGENHPLHRLTESDVKEIRTKFQPRKYTREMLGREYGVKPSTIKAIVLNRLWRHVA